MQSGPALAGGPCPTGQLGDGVTCKVNPCFLKNGGCDALTTCAADTATGDAVCGRGLHSPTSQHNLSRF